MVERLWNTSPATLSAGLRRRLRRLQEGEEWQRVAAGPAGGVELCLPVPLQNWGREMADGTFDSFLYTAIARHRKLAGAQCWDIGAHVGYHALAFAAQGAQVVAFEPGGVNIARFKLHLERNKEPAQRIRLVTAAVADRDGEMTFVESDEMKGESTGSHLATATPPLRDEIYAQFRQRTVPTVTIDSFVEKQGMPAPDIMKIDVEGAEHLVIQGGRVTLARHKPLLLVEVHHICVMFSLAPLLLELGYRLEILDRENASPSRCFISAC
jgi:FkbM family methyltransferase